MPQRKFLTVTVGILGVLLALAGLFYLSEYIAPENPGLQVKREEYNAQTANADMLIARSHIPGYWIAALERDPMVVSGNVSEIDKATVDEIVFRTKKTKQQSFDTYKSFFTKNDWKIGTDDYAVGKLSFSNDSVGQIVFVQIEEVTESKIAYSQISLKRLIAHE